MGLKTFDIEGVVWVCRVGQRECKRLTADEDTVVLDLLVEGINEVFASVGCRGSRDPPRGLFVATASETLLISIRERTKKVSQYPMI